MLLAGWISDTFFCNRRIPICIIYMLTISIAILFHWLIPIGNPLYNGITLLKIGFFIYGPAFLIGNVQALDLVPKKAAGTAAGFTSFFGYIIGTTIATVGVGWIIDHFAWNMVFIILLISCVLAILFLAFIE